MKNIKRLAAGTLIGAALAVAPAVAMAAPAFASTGDGFHSYSHDGGYYDRDYGRHFDNDWWWFFNHNRYHHGGDWS